MALRQRDANSNMASRETNAKRKHVAIDLTGDSDDDDRASKARKSSATNSKRHGYNQSQTRPGASAYLTPASSAPSSSWRRNENGQWEKVHVAAQHHPRNQYSRAERQSWLNDNEEGNDDWNELMPSSTQAAAANTDLLHHYGDLPTKIVGCQYYRGNASQGEQILMRREPSNPYDTNAIRIDNVAGTQIGHIPRKVAVKLSKFMDNSYLHVEGELAGEIGTFDCPIQVRMYGPDPQSEEGVLLAAEMKAEKLPLNVLKAAEDAEKRRQKQLAEAEKQRKIEEKRQIAIARRNAANAGSGNGRGGPSSSQPNGSQGFSGSSQAAIDAVPVMVDILEAAQRFNPREIGNATDQYGLKEEGLKNMPMAAKPAGIKTEMLPYQLQALQWLLDQEDPQLPAQGSQDTVQLWKRHARNNKLFTNVATTYTPSDSPKLVRGGILADDMGLGKTLEVISLLIADKEKAGSKTAPTLIVAPLSVMSNWSGQIAQHVHESHALSVYVYHGAGRIQSMSPWDFAEHDVVITTYQTLANDYMPKPKGGLSRSPERALRSTGLYSVDWRRVVLDEGHQIRNPTAKAALAATNLISHSKWVLTGTPIVNSLRDLYTLLRFLGVTGGLENLEIFNRVLVRPLKQGDTSATFLLQAIMTAFTLRRRKDMAYIDLKLPKLDEYVHRIEFTMKEKERYDALLSEAQGVLTKYEDKAGGREKGAGEAFAHLLEILLRMRQCCNHWQLCAERVTNLLAKLEEQKTVDLTPENKRALQDMLQIRIESQEDCPVCFETLSNHDPCITTCGHSFCKMCISKTIEEQKKCPMCRAALEDESCLVAPDYDCGDVAADDEMDLAQSSSKLEGMMETLEATKAKGDKTVVFSQWTRFLDIVEARLDGDGYRYCRIDGTMNAQKRDAALKALAEDPKCTVMLASLGVCAVGLNLTAANQVILSDTWWAPAIEDQAVDRVHRLGQKKETRVFRLIMDQTIEEETIRIQTEKRKLMQLAFSEKGSKRDQAKTGKLADIQRLLRGPSAAQASTT